MQRSDRAHDQSAFKAFSLCAAARNAMFTTVTLMDSETGETIATRTYDRRVCGLSPQAMDPYVTKELLDLKENSIDIHNAAHDDKSVSGHVRSHVNADGTKSKDQLDC